MESQGASLSFRLATSADVPAVVALVNRAYRGDASKAGWTTEADLLQGPRTDEAEVARLVEGPDSIVLLCFAAQTLLGSVTLRQHGPDVAHLGMLVVEPAAQAAGTGKALIDRAEREVVSRWGCATMVMSVITLRTELIAFYERRGYHRTGRTHRFPEEALSEPQVRDLTFEDLEKSLT